MIASIWLADRGAPTNSGSSSGPAGILDFMPTTAPPTANASVPRSGPTATGGNQSIAARRRAARGRPCPGDDRRHESDAGDAQILHDRDQPHVAAESFRHQHHGGRRAGRGAPDRRRARKHFPAGEHIAESGREEDDRADQNQEHRPLPGNRHHDVRGDASRHQAADNTLSDNKGPGRNLHPSLEPRQQDPGRDRAKHQRRGQARQFEGRNADERGAEKHAPLQSRRSLAQGEGRHSILSRREGEGVAVRHPGDPWERYAASSPGVASTAMLVVTSRDDHQFVAKLPRLPRGRFNADMRGDAAEDDGPYPTALELGIEVGAEERAPGRLGDRECRRAPRGRAARSAKPAGKVLGSAEGSSTALWPVSGGLTLTRTTGAPAARNLPRERLAAFEQFVSRERLEFAAEHAVLQVDQHEGGCLGSRAIIGGLQRKAAARGLREVDL